MIASIENPKCYTAMKVLRSPSPSPSAVSWRDCGCSTNKRQQVSRRRGWREEEERGWGRRWREAVPEDEEDIRAPGRRRAGCVSGTIRTRTRLKTRLSRTSLPRTDTYSWFLWQFTGAYTPFWIQGPQPPAGRGLLPHHNQEEQCSDVLS